VKGSVTWRPGFAGPIAALKRRARSSPPR